MSDAFPHKRSSFPFSRKTMIFLIVLFVLAGLFFSLTPEPPDADEEDVQEFFQLKKGPLDIVVAEAGVIKAREKEIIRSEVEGITTILWVIEEGREVEEGELLLELDASKLQHEIVNQGIVVNNAEASYVNVREKLDVVKNQAESDIEMAELKQRFAEQDLKKYTGGEYPNTLKELESNVLLKKETLQRSEEKLEWSKKLRGENFLSGAELDSDELTVRKAQIELELAKENLALLKNYTFQRTVDELESEVRQSRMALERTKRKAAADVIQAEAELQARKSQHQQEKSKLEKLQNQLAKTRILAPSDGLVIYATTAKGWRSNKPPLAAGQDVKERQELIYLTRNLSMLAETRIPEVNLNKVKVGLPAQVTVDAFPGQVFTGHVAFISPLPDAESNWFNANLKYYPTMIYLEGDVNSLRTGMNCQAEILVKQYTETLFAPVQTVVKKNGHSFVYLEGRQDPVQVEIGMDNNIMIRLESGVKEGDRLLLTPPF